MNYKKIILLSAVSSLMACPYTQGMPNFPRGTIGDNDSVPAISCDTVVSSTSALENAISSSMVAGTSICLDDGNYTNLDLVFGGDGTSENPITVAAKNSGKAIIGGEVRVRMSGEYVVLQGLVFKNGESASSDLIQTRGSNSRPCNYCRITEISIIDFDQNNTSSGKWLNIYGHHNRIDHSWFAGKTTRGALLIINREVSEGGSGSSVEIDYAQIDHNYFGDRAPLGGKAYAESSANELEAIRVGTSDSHTGDSFSVIEHNYFERIQGEAEVISNKSGNNTYFNNTIRESFGSLTTRHGSSATISNNFIIGDDYPLSGGLRIIDDGHRIVNNYIEGVRYKNTRFHGGIVIHNSDGSTSNGYQQVENVLIANNTIVDSVNSLNVFGGKKKRKPRNVYLVNNIIADAIGPIITRASNGMPDDSVFAGNYFYGQSFSDNPDLTAVTGISEIDAQLIDDRLGIARPGVFSPAMDAVTDVDLGSFAAVANDMDGQRREGTTQSGADHVSTVSASLGVLNAYDVGPLNYRPEFSKLGVVKVELANHDFDEGNSGWDFTNAQVTTDSNEVFSRGASARVADASGKLSQRVNVERNANYTLSAFVRGPASIGAELNGTTAKVDNTSASTYKFQQVSFNSGNNSSVTLFAALDDFVQNAENIIDHDFDTFAGSDSNGDGVDDGDGDGAWRITESDSIGHVQRSKNSAKGADGSVIMKYKTADEEGGLEPQISQVITGLQPNTQYTLSMYVLTKNNSTATVTMGAYQGESTSILASKTVDYEALKASGAPKGDDKFYQDSLTFNSGDNTSVTIFAEYNSNTIISSGGTAKQTEIRIDEFVLSYDGAPAPGSTGFFDSFRLVKHREL